MREGIAKFRKTLTYEGTGTLAEVEEDIAEIRGLDLQAQGRKWMAWLTPLPLPLFLLLAVSANDETGSPALCVIGIVVFIAGIVGYNKLRRYDVENRRYELANGLIRLLDLAPNTPLKVGLVLTDIQVGSKVKRREGSWTYYEDPWLYIEGQLADGIYFHYGRTSFFDYYFHTRTSGNRRTTTTRKIGRFQDSLTFTYDAQRYPHVAAMGMNATQQIPLPEGVEGKHLQNDPGRLSMLIECGYKWDAGAGGSGKGMDAVSFAGLLFLLFYRLVDAHNPRVDLGRSKALPPPKVTQPKAPMLPKEMIYAGVGAALAIGSITLATASYFYFGDASRDSGYAEELEADLKADIKDNKCAKKKKNRKPYCLTNDKIEQRRDRIEEYEDGATEDTVYAIIFLVLALPFGLAGGGSIFHWRKNRPRWLEDAEKASEGADVPPPQPQAQPQPYPPQHHQPQPYPPQQHQQQPPPGGYPPQGGGQAF